MAKISPENIRFSIQLAIMVVSWLLMSQANQNQTKEDLKDLISEVMATQKVHETRLIALEKCMEDQKDENRDIRNRIDFSSIIPEPPTFQNIRSKRR